jgi:hypothetical protein
MSRSPRMTCAVKTVRLAGRKPVLGEEEGEEERKCNATCLTHASQAMTLPGDKKRGISYYVWPDADMSLMMSRPSTSCNGVGEAPCDGSQQGQGNRTRCVPAQ